MAARRLPSGDILVTTASREARVKLQESTDWLQALGAGAKVKRRTYVVLAHGIRLDQLDISKQLEAIAAIYKQNLGLKAKVNILSIA